MWNGGWEREGGVMLDRECVEWWLGERRRSDVGQRVCGMVVDSFQNCSEGENMNHPILEVSV